MTVKLSTNKACGPNNIHKPLDFKAKCVFYITCRSHDCTILEADISGLRVIKALYAKVLVLFILLTLILEDFDSIFALHIHYQTRKSWFRSGLREIWEVFTLKTFEFEVVGSTKYLDGCLGACWGLYWESISRILIHILVHKWATRG